MATELPRLGIVSTEPIRQAGLASLFEALPLVVAVEGDLDSLLADQSLQYLIIDLSSSAEWLEILFTIRRRRPELRQIVIGPAGEDALVMKSIVAGARGFLDRDASPQTIRRAVQTVLGGSIWAPRRMLSKLIDRLLSHSAGVSPIAPAPPAVLSPREHQVLDLIMAARSNREIALELGIEERTVKAYVASLLRKKGAENRVSLSVLATQESLRVVRGRLQS